jgi:hypothetical protein
MNARCRRRSAGVSSDAGGLLLGASELAIRLVDRFAACFRDARRQELIEHEVATLVGQRIFGIALGYEDLNNHERHDPIMAVLAGKLEAGRQHCAPVAGKSTLNQPSPATCQPDPALSFVPAPLRVLSG